MFFTRSLPSISSALLSCLLFPVLASAETHIVTVGDNFFSPNDLTIQVGDTVRWENAAGGAPHDVTADDFSFASPLAASFTYDRVFNSAEEVLYHCTVHSAPGLDRNSNMNGRITVEGTSTGFNSNQLAWSVNGTDFTNFSSSYDAADSYSLQSFDLSMVNDLEDATSAYLRLSFDGATGSSGNNRIDNIQLTAIPEPSTTLLLFIGAGSLILLRHR